ncbi:MAG: signal transduction histidine kinase [Candidatus Parvibacillus calidus]|nr:MAG: signal transduction histidine kinase [Candidatus Parvibacillus calidus]WKZ62705.1 MAG: sensor histidine kinase [Saprospiraceae bacterium]
MIFRSRFAIFLFILALCIITTGCKKTKPDEIHFDTKKNFWEYIEKGNEIYSKKSDLKVFGKAKNYFDSAMLIAEHLKDTMLLAEATYAYGKVFDAWNSNPALTLAYYKKAEELFAKSDSVEAALYMKFHVAHAYNGVKDSTNCIKQINEILGIIDTLPGSVANEIRFLPEVAMEAANAGDFDLAETILDKYVNKSNLKNDTLTLNHKDHYYYTRAVIQIQKNISTSSYLDTLEQVFQEARTTGDSMFYASVLSKFYEKTGNFKKSLYYSGLNYDMTFRFINKHEYVNLGQKLAEMELNALEQENQIETKSFIILFVSITALALLSLASIYLNVIIGRSRLKHIRVSKELEESHDKISLLYKELHHRIKNNLHMIFSLLQMQERKATVKATIENLRAARLRIESIAVLHEEMMRETYLVDFRDFIERMIEIIKDCFSYSHEIKTNLDFNNVEIPLKQSFSLALIINEWITNSIKHANTSGKPLAIYINFTEIDDKIKVEYWDNGTVDIRIQPQTGFGSEIITLLAKQIGKLMITDQSNPYYYAILINKN